MARPFLLVSFLVAAGCSSAPAEAPPAVDAQDALTFREIWTGMDEIAARMEEPNDHYRLDPIETCSGPFETWFHDFGTRGVACMAAQVVDPTAFVALAPVMPFRKGPHLATPRTVTLALTTPREFGAYDPAFVSWLRAAAIPEGQMARRVVQPVYDRHLARLARIYWLTHRDLERGGFPASTPDGPLASYAEFLAGGPASDGLNTPGGGFSVFAFTNRSETLLPAVELTSTNEWEVKYEANTAYGFWLRRRADGTHALWYAGLRDLLSAFDADWLADHS